VRRLVLGIDENGRSCIAESDAVAACAVEGVPHASIARLFAIDQGPPPPTPRGLGRYRPDVLPPGHVDWYVIEHAPRGEDGRAPPPRDLHYRDVVDLILIIEGGAQLILGDGPHAVSAGDCIVMAGAEHAFQPDPGGCRLMGLAIGAQVAPN
jgi:mannose-6-phosphate isomerase-like protein (cupin superfamily)